MEPDDCQPPLLWVVGLVLCVFVAREKGRSGVGWFVGALFCSPLLALLALAAVPVVGSAPASPAEPRAAEPPKSEKRDRRRYSWEPDEPQGSW